MKHWLRMASLIVLVAGLAACNVENPPEAPADPGGPALIMFYTDN